MTEAHEESDYSLNDLGGHFNAHYVGGVVISEVRRLQTELNGTIDAIQRLVPYLSDTYYTDSQRGIAERELFRLKGVLTTQTDEINNTLVMAPELNLPVTVTHT